MKYIAGLVSWFGICDRNDENVLRVGKSEGASCESRSFFIK